MDTHAVLPDIAETSIELPTELIKQEEADELWRALQHVKQWQREVIILHYYQAYDLATMAHILGVKEGTVKVRLFRARRALQSQLVLTEGVANNDGGNGRPS